MVAGPVCETCGGKEIEYLGGKSKPGWLARESRGSTQKTVWRGGVRKQVVLELAQEASLCFKRIVQTLSHHCYLYRM